jgi:hypothetical protein
MHNQHDIRDEGDLQDILNNLRVFLDFSKAIKGRMDVTIRVDSGFIDLAWLEQHAGHRLAVRCEYESWQQLEERIRTGLGWWDYQEAEKAGAVRG